MKVRITYNNGFVLETEMSNYVFDYYTNQRNPLYNVKCPCINFVSAAEKEFVSLYGAVKIEKVDESK